MKFFTITEQIMSPVKYIRGFCEVLLNVHLSCNVAVMFFVQTIFMHINELINIHVLPI